METTAIVNRPSRARAFAWMSGALAGFLVMGISGRELAQVGSIFQLLVYRNAICLILVLAILCVAGWSLVHTRHVGWHLARSVIHIAGQYAWFFAVVWLPLAEVFALEFTTPIWTALFAVTLLGERLTPWRSFAIVCGFAGVMFILRPGIAIIQPAALAAIGAAVCFAAAYAITKSMVARERPMTILFWMHLVQLPIGLAPALAVGWVTPPPHLWHHVAALGLAGFATHYCIARALSHADATVVVPLDFLRLPLGACIGWLLYAETLDPLVGVGAALIVTASWVSLRRG